MYYTGLCRKHHSVDYMSQGLCQPIAMTLSSDSSNNSPRCHKTQRETARRRLSILDSAESDQEDGEGSSEEEGDGRKGSEDTADLEKEEEEEDGDEGGQLTLSNVMWQEVRVKLRGIVESKYFNRGIMIAILVNTISMGIEHHEQVTRWYYAAEASQVS